MIDLKGKIALITGASGGIGGATARKLHSLGAHVIISGTNVEKLESLAKELGGNCTVRPCNLKDKAECIKLIDDLEHLDIVVCNAGITKDGLALRMPIEAFEEVIDVNLTSSFLLNQAAIKKMMKNKTEGRIINISSVVAVSGNPGQANYCASKAGLIGMTKSLAMEVASRAITINCVAPGFIVSDMTNSLTDAQKEMVMQKIPMKQFGKTEDIGSAVAFLASKEASYITGQTLHVNGGMLMV
ncbi:MAG: 3-oxoacyl-ACP reductase FabG [Rickettsiaceae bacterium]|nr:3-oxoacyl-ACP reductase FabG [Rickettsiaceae bacterium]